MSVKNKLSFITYAYAIGAIFVVLGHSTPTGFTDMPFWIDDIRTFIYNFHMPLFFFVAGFLFKYTYELRTKKYSAFIKDKSMRFLIPYFVLTAIGIIPKILLSGFVNDDVSFSFKYIFTVVFNPRLNVWGHFWFLPTLLIIYVFSYLLIKATNNKIIFSLLLLFAFTISCFPPDFDWLAVNDLCDQFIFFCLGLLFENILINKRKKVLRADVALLTMAIAIIMFVYFKNNYYFLSDFIFNASNVLEGILMLYTLLYVSVFFENKGSKVLDYFDGKTFTIYILSWPCQAITEIVLNRIFNMHWYIVIPAMFIVGLCVPLLIIEIYNKLKWHPKIINLIFGFTIKKG